MAGNRTVGMAIDANYDIARQVFHAMLFASIVASLVLGFAVRKVVSRTGYKLAGPKRAYRLGVLALALSDLVASCAVFDYITPPWDSCLVASILGSTGQLLSCSFTACVSIEAWYLVEHGARTGEMLRFSLYVIFTLAITGAAQLYASQGPRFEDVLHDNNIWCHLQNKDLWPGEFFAYYLIPLLTWLICLISYGSMCCKLFRISRNPLVREKDRLTFRRAGCRFFTIPVVFMVCWVPTAVHRTFSPTSAAISGDGAGHWIFLYINTSLLTLLPLFNLIAIAFVNLEVRREIACGVCTKRKYVLSEDGSGIHRSVFHTDSESGSKNSSEEHPELFSSFHMGSSLEDLAEWDSLPSMQVYGNSSDIMRHFLDSDDEILVQ